MRSNAGVIAPELFHEGTVILQVSYDANLRALKCGCAATIWQH